jgi:hypothetical protein
MLDCHACSRRLAIRGLAHGSQRFAGACEATMAWNESACGLRTASNTATSSLAALSVLVHSRTRRREQGLCATSAETATRQLSDYHVDDPYIQAHLHGPSSRLVLDLDDSPNVLRDEAVMSTN